MNTTLNSLATAKVINEPKPVSNSDKLAFLEKALKAVASAIDSRVTPALIDLQNFRKSGHPVRENPFCTTVSNVLISWIDKPRDATNDPEEKVGLLEALAKDLADRNTKIARSVAEDIRQALTCSDYAADAIEL